MNYSKIYSDFIADRRIKESVLKQSKEYVEKHHIIPRSLGGGNEKENLILLTAEDHIFAHLFLARIYKNKEMWAAVKFIFGNSIKLSRSPSRKMIRIAAKAKEEFAKRNSGANNINFGKALSESRKEFLREINTGKKHSAESRGLISKSLEGNVFAKGFKHNEETRKKVAIASTGRLHSDATKKKISDANTGKILSEETKSKLSASKIGKPRLWILTQETRDKLSAANKGKLVSIETREKQSKSRTGMTASNATKIKMSLGRVGGSNPRAKKILCISTGEIFGSISLAAEKFSMPSPSFRSKLSRGNGEAMFGDVKFKII